MTYCIERTNLLAKAGRDLSLQLLPKPFELWHSDHDTGRQMTIVTRTPAGEFLTVWRGSVWHSHIYEFNDRDHVPGLQPDFAFAAPVIEKYFADVAEAIAKRSSEIAAANEDRAARIAADKQAAIDAVRVSVQP